MAERQRHRMGIVQREPWTAYAVCRGVDPDLFYPERYRPDQVAQAKAVCAGCPVAGPCLDYANAHNEPGIWGGLSERQRKRRRAKRAA